MITLSVLVAVTIFGLSEASWPDGRYCLPMPRTKVCPLGWASGVRIHDMEDGGASADCDKKKHGWVPYNEKFCRDLGWGFCCKTRPSYTGKAWPQGSYCIFRYGGSCPWGFDEGLIKWDDEDNNNANGRRGVLPDGVYNRDTKIYFCCRNDRTSSSSLRGLPKCREIMVMRYKGRCSQRPNGYRGPHRGYLQWNTEDNKNTDHHVGVFPDGRKTFATGIKIEFCSYTSNYDC